MGVGGSGGWRGSRTQSVWKRSGVLRVCLLAMPPMMWQCDNHFRNRTFHLSECACLGIDSDSPLSLKATFA